MRATIQIHRVNLWTILCVVPWILVPCGGCQSMPLPPTQSRTDQHDSQIPVKSLAAPGKAVRQPVQPAAFRHELTGSDERSDASSRDIRPAPSEPADALSRSGHIIRQSVVAADELARLEFLAQSTNPRLTRLQRQANAAAAKTQHVDSLPDPTVGTNIFGHPIETAAGSQRANLTLMQMIPWLDRLNAQQQQACFEAMALQQMYAAERLRMNGDVRAGYYRLYVLNQQIVTIEANQELLESLLEIINARVATGSASQGDVLLGTLELSRLQKQIITLRQQARSAAAGINRIVSRPADTPIAIPDELTAPSPDWTHAMLVRTAFQYQPVIAAAQLQANASRWGVEVAELKRRPDFQIGAAWFFMEGNRPPTNIVDVGRDAWSLGATMSIPLDRNKYDAIREEARWKNAASHANVQDVRQEFDARLLDLLEQAKAADETARLYRNTIIPQSEQTLAADQESMIDGTVEFDRVIQDFRSLLTVEFEYHGAIGELATSIARIRQAVGTDIRPQAQSSEAAAAVGVLPADGSDISD